jgi:two-component system, chemotaxis family, sensor kinase CheA
MPDPVDRSNPGEPGAGTLYREARELAFELSLGGPAAPDRAKAMWRRAEEAEAADLAAPLRALAEALETGRSVEARLAQLEAVLAPAPEVAANPFASDPQLLADFFSEAREHLVNIEARLLELEQRPETAEAINSLFRSFHTLKGLAGFLEFNAIQEVAHEVETLLDLARNGQFRLDTGAIDSVLAARDYVERWLKQLEQGAPAPPAATALMEEIRALARGEGAAPAVTEVAEAKAPEQVRSAAAETAQVRVNTAKLEYMVDMVGELVIAQAMLRHDEDLAALKAPRVQRNLSQLARVTAEVQKTAMAMRMVPIGQLFRRMTRLVRDLSHKSGKRAELDMFGEEVELDRTIVEELADPLVHMLRNSMDHGLEGPEERTAAGKAPMGRVALKAWHQSGQILIEVSDDGRGLRRDRILAKALERGLVKSGEGLTDSEVYNLIFEPGFSTAERVTEVSGRGVGMDVVRKQVEKLRGRVDVDSEPGRGTRFTLRVPLTLAIIDGLVVKAGGERFILPISSVREMFRPTREKLFSVEGRRELALVREKLLPVVRLYQKFGLRPKSEDPCEGLMVVGEADGRPFCLLVDEMLGKQEVVIKSLGPVFRQVEGLAGGAILGDGRVGLILEMSALAREQGHGGARV